MSKYDLAIIGSGPGGYIAAIRAAQLGNSVAIIERDKPGGVCLNWGCIPSKAILKCAEVYDTFKHPSDYGISADNVSFDYSKIIEKSRRASARLSKGVEYLFKKNNIKLYPGTARFITANKLGITCMKREEEIEASRIIIATGTVPRTLPGLKIDGKRVMTSDEAIISKDMPASIAIIGGGAIGVEFAYIYATYGCDVTIVEMEPHILPEVDREAAVELQKQFKRMGIRVFTNTRFSSIKSARGGIKGGIKVKLEGDIDKSLNPIGVEKVLVAVGRRALTEHLGYEEIGVELDERGYIKTDDAFMTTKEGVYAIGDVIGPPLLAHKASEEGIAAVEMMSGVRSRPVDYSVIPACIYCQPEVASVGLTEEECKERGLDIDIGKFPFQASGKAVATGETKGFVKIISNKTTGEVLGAHIIGRAATELIGEIALGKALESTPLEIAETPHSHPTLSESIMEAALASLGRARSI